MQYTAILNGLIEAVLTSTHNLGLRAKHKKIMYTPETPILLYKSGVLGGINNTGGANFIPGTGVYMGHYFFMSVLKYRLCVLMRNATMIFCLFDLMLYVLVNSYGLVGTSPPFLWDFYPTLKGNDTSSPVRSTTPVSS